MVLSSRNNMMNKFKENIEQVLLEQMVNNNAHIGIAGGSKTFGNCT